MKKTIYFMLIAFSCLVNYSCGGSESDAIENDEKPAITTPTFPVPTWKVDIVNIQQSGKYQNTMTMYAVLPATMLADTDDDDLMAVFCGAELRGVATKVALTKNVYVWQAMIYGNDNDAMTCKYYSANTKYMYETPVFHFKSDTQYGTPDQPATLPLSLITAR